MKTILFYAALLIAISAPASMSAQCSAAPASVHEVECMLMEGDFKEFKAQYAGFDCLVAFYDSLSMLAPSMGREPILTWSSEYTFEDLQAPSAGLLDRTTAYCSLWMRGLFWIYLSANRKLIQGNEEGRLCGRREFEGYCYDLIHTSPIDPITGKSDPQKSGWAINHEIVNNLDQLYCDAFVQSQQLRTFSKALREGLATHGYAWKIEHATVYNAKIPANAKWEKEFRFERPTKPDSAVLKSTTSRHP